MLKRSVVPALAAVLTLVALAGGGAAGGRAATAIRQPHEDPSSPGDFLLAQRSWPSGRVGAGAFDRAAGQAERLAARTRNADPALAAAPWQLAGPTDIGGRVTDIAVAPTDQNTVYAATANGGVWKSTDAGTTFSSAWPSDRTQAIGALQIASDGTLFAGTGEANPGGGSITFGGDGVYRSKDGGATWQPVGLPASGAIGRIAIDPTNPKRLFAAASGNLFTPGGERGLYRSTDGGDTWQLVLPGANATTGAVDVAIDPQHPQTVFAAMWDHQRLPDLRVYGGVGSGLYRSTDGGDTWTQLGGGLPVSSPNVGRIGVAVDPTAPQNVYAIYTKTLGQALGFFTSSDGGTTWKAGGAVGGQSTYGWWFGRIWVDPNSSQHLFAAGVNLLESFNAGATWVTTPTTVLGSTLPVHADQHAMAWDPKVPGRVYLGNDGGFYRSDADGIGGSFAPSTYEPFTQFYSVDVGEQDPTRIVGGAQDNGALRSYPGAWNSYGGGDGQETLISPADQNVVYACSQYGVCAKSTDGGSPLGANSTDFTSATQGSRRNWFTPLLFDPSNPNVMYYGSDVVNRSTDGGVTWTAISDDLTLGKDRDTQYPFATITTIAAAKSDPNVLYVGTDDGLLWTTKDLGQTWTQVNRPNLPNRWVTRVAVDPTDANIAYATFSGFRNGAHDAHVFRTTDGGVTWTSISGGLPAAPVNDIVVVGRSLYVGTDVGVFSSSDGGATWLAAGSGLPLAPIMDLRYHAPSNTLFAATFGRGIYQLSLPPA